MWGEQRLPSPGGRGLERTSAQRSFLRERVRVDPHPTWLRQATFSQWEKDKI